MIHYLHSCKVVPHPSDVCWLINPMKTIDISPTKTLVFGVICTNFIKYRNNIDYIYIYIYT